MRHNDRDPHPEPEPKKTARAERELMRGAGPAAVLALLERRGEMYGYELVAALSADRAAPSTWARPLCTPCSTTSRPRDSCEATWRQTPGGRRRKYYALTPRGRRRLDVHRRQWRDVTRALARLGVLERTGG